MEAGTGAYWFEGGLAGEERQRFDLPRTETVVFGRDKACQIQIKDARVSRKHAEVTWQEEGYQLTDLDTVNGTFVNGAAIRSSSLKVGDRVEIGNAVFVLHGPATAKGRGMRELIQCGYCNRKTPASSSVCPGCGAPID